MNLPNLRIVLLSDFDAQNLGFSLRAMRDGTDVAAGNYGQVAQHVLDIRDPLWASPTDVAVVWTTPQHASPTFQAAFEGKPWNAADLEHDVDAHVELIARLVGRAAFVLLPTWSIDPRFRNRGLLTTRTGLGVHNALTRINLRLMEACEKQTGLFVMPVEPILASAGAGAFSSKHWYLSKWPFGLEVAKSAALDILSAVDATRGAAKKLIVLDLDDTLWGGTIGEDGLEGLVLGGHDAVGEAFIDFQRALKTLARSGVLLAIVSKNDEALALQAIDHHPEMVLRRDSYATWRINWDDKAANIGALADELSLGLDAIVFIDDNPAERDRVRAALPLVSVPEWPVDKMMYAQTLRGLRCFDTAVISDEDRTRTQQYAVERSRTTVLHSVGSVEEWVKTLDVHVSVAPLDLASLARAAQLLNKTNQMNLATRRMTSAELLMWTQTPRQTFFTVRAADRLGDYGLIGLFGLRDDGSQLEMVDFVLSCRAMGRGIEEAMVGAGIEVARLRARPRLIARYEKTQRNAACLKKLLELSAAFDCETNTFTWATTTPHQAFGGVQVSYEGIESAVR